jgi:proteasome lid subunit RPN8/RPN11
MQTETDRESCIDIGESAYPETGRAPLPSNFVAIGAVENDDVKVYILRDVYEEIERFARSDTARELGGILLGLHTARADRLHVIISAFIEARYADASASTLTFTHETWDFVHREHARLHPDLKILGWQHTHPNYGIFLSNYDMFIQENFFNLPFHVAYVTDPKRNQRGFFQWKNGKVEKLSGFCVYDEAGETILLGAEEEDFAAPAVRASAIPVVRRKLL